MIKKTDFHLIEKTDVHLIEKTPFIKKILDTKLSKPDRYELMPSIIGMETTYHAIVTKYGTSELLAGKPCLPVVVMI